MSVTFATNRPERVALERLQEEHRHSMSGLRSVRKKCERCGSTTIRDFSQKNCARFMCLRCYREVKFVVGEFHRNSVGFDELDWFNWEWVDREERTRRLREVGYVESKSKIDSYYKKCQSCIMFYGRRSYHNDGYWLASCKPYKRSEEWSVGRCWQDETRALRDNKIPFVEPHYGADYMWWRDGYCTRCKTDLRSDGILCGRCGLLKDCDPDADSDITNETSCRPFPFLVNGRPHYRCAACMNTVLTNDAIIHHIEYSPPKLCAVHRGCHTNIHHNARHAHLAPPPGDAALFYGKNKITRNVKAN